MLRCDGGSAFGMDRAYMSLRARKPPKLNLTGSGGGGWGRWSSGGSGRQRPLRRPPLQHHNTDTHMYTESLVCPAPPSPAPSGGPSSWAASLELLLADPAGVHALSAFLEREFSAENIRFWTACERYAYAPASERPALAFTVHNTHLAEGAPEPVNVDAHARQHARDHLHEAPHDLFLQAQKQIFNLMKFDSYPRFIKSEVHRECLLAERRGGAPPYPGDPALACQPSPTKLKKSVSNAEDRRRKSLIPWHRKQRSKSRDRCEGAQEEEEEEEGRGETHSTHGGSNSSLLSTWDLAKGIGHKCGSTCSCCEGAAKCPSRAALCRVLLPGAAATSSVVAVGSHTVQQLLERLLLKHAVHFRAYEVYLPNSNKPIDIQQSSSVLAGLEVTVEQRVVFKLDLPNRKVISVKSKPNKALGDVLRPILHKYGVTGGSATCVTLKNTPLQLTQPVQVVDGQRLQVSLLSGPESEPQSAVPQTAAKTSHSAADAANGAPSLDEITNRVFEELLQGKADRHKPNGEEDSIKSDNCSSEHSSGIFGRFLRRDDHRSKGLKIKRVAAAAVGQTRPSTNSSPASAPGSVASDGTESKGPLIAKLRAGVRVQNAVGAPTALENTEFLENLKQIQKVRLKDKTINNNFIHPPLLNGQETQPGKENSKTIPVAAIRLTPPVLSITKPSPAPRLSLGQGSPTKLNPKAVEATQETNNKTEEIIPTKVQAYNSLEKKNLDNNNIENKYHSNLTQDYLNGSTTSGSDHFMRSCDILNSSFNSTSSSCENDKHICDPPPLPPKPKVLPIKPSNWGHSLTDEAIINLRMQEVSLPEIGSKDGLERTKRTVYLDQPSSSFV